jgi:hypothetical protein
MAGGNGILLMQSIENAIDVRLCLPQRDAGLQTADNIQIVRVTVGAELALPIGGGAEHLRNGIDGIDPDLQVVPVTKVHRKNPDDGNRAAIQNDAAAGDAAIACEVTLPETVREERNPRCAEYAVGQKEGASEDWLYAEDRKEIGHGHDAGKALGRALAGQSEADAVRRSQFLEGLVLGF